VPQQVSPTHRWLLVIVAALAIGAVVGMIALWPDRDRLPEAGEELEDLVLAQIVAFDAYEGEPSELDEEFAPFGPSLRRADIDVELLDGPEEGRVVTLRDLPLDGYPDLSVGDRVTLDRVEAAGTDTEYFITDFQRTPTLLILLGLFVLAVVLIGRWHGLRSLLGLGLSLMIVIVFVVPAILAGQSPPLVALVGAVAVMIVTLYLAHGVNEMTSAAIVGTTGALVLTVGLGLWFIDRSKITGYASDDALFASFAVQGLDLQGLVLAGLIIAALGVLDDVTVSQASTVFALHDTDRNLTWTALFARAMRVGRDHIASVVNTLFLAYAGASLALLVLFSTGGVGTAEIVNSEIIAEEIVKIIVGSLGLIAAVPLTTALAARVAVDRPSDAPPLRGDGHGHWHGPGPHASAANDEPAAESGVATEPVDPPSAPDEEGFDPDRISLGMDRFHEQVERGDLPRPDEGDEDPGTSGQRPERPPS
jgi:uncharacterized membrane protein